LEIYKEKFLKTHPFLYFSPDFFNDDIAVERLPGLGITGDHLNDDVFGRTLNAIAKYGPTRLFNETLAKCLLLTEFGSHYVHVNTSGFSVTGEYDPEYDVVGVQITYGYPKDGRWNLK